ncbi:MAG TPA: TonB-dependent siderophore receptor [Terracidiphilus sp.]|nr:TonB-dependent siderophore receptor [Terracidiphilus sp.]
MTTTVVVRGQVTDDYLSTGSSAASLDGASLLETPIAVTAVSHAVLSDQMARVLADVVKNDASVGENYAPVGYYGDFAIRGFPIDLATGIQINGMTVAGEQDVPMEMIQRVEFVKGIAGVESGVASAGGLINFVTKQPYAGQRPAIDLATDHRGTAYGALDIGHIFHSRLEPGVRLNLAGEDIHTYVQHAGGWRGMGAVGSTWRLDPATDLRADFAYQHKVQRSAAGYQLLGGTIVPADVFPSVMLGYQSWSKPNTFDSINAGSRLRHSLNANWSARIEGSYSRSLIDDNVIWPYGPALDAGGNSLCPGSPYYFFCPDGSYEIYDYRSPGEVWMDVVGAALVQGSFSTGWVSHRVVGGGSLFRRTVELSPTVVYVPLGVENIYRPNVAYAPETPYQQAGPAALADYNHQAAVLVQDRITLPGGISLLAGGRVARVTDFNYLGARTQWLPQYAATYSPRHDVTLYANYGVLLSLGPQAPWWVDNSSAFLEPFHTRQSEAGVKFEHNMLVTVALFRMRQPFFYPRIIQQADRFCPGSVAADDLCFEAMGHETHTGIEVNAQGKATKWMQLTASAAGLRAISSDTGTPAFDGKQVINVPRFRVSMSADLLLTHLSGLHLMPGWSYAGSKEATRDDAVHVAGYHLINLGARYTPGGEQGHMTIRLYADNILNKRYWKDTGASYGDTFIHLGAPATVRLSARYTF